MKNDDNQRQAFLEEWQRKHPKPTPGQLIELLQKLGRPPTVYSADMDPTKVRCACNKDVPCDKVQLVNTGQMSAVEPVCKPCRKDFKGQARIVCISCRSVIGWVEPQVDPHGFKLEPDHYYHVAVCGVCKKDLQKANIIEMMLYYDDIGVPYDKDPLI